MIEVKMSNNSLNKIILWTTQCQAFSDEENIKNIRCVLRAIENMDETTLLIKQHPLETYKHEKLIINISNNYKTDFKLVSRDSDTYEQIYSSDLVLVKNSTTALEAVALDKPVIVLNLSGKLDDVDYVEKNVALGVYNENDLEDAFRILIENDTLKKYRKSYVEEHLHAIDGRSSIRIAELIEKMVDGDI